MPVLGAVANIAKKYDDRVNYRNQPPEIRKQMGLQNSYDFKSEVFVEEKKITAMKKVFVIGLVSLNQRMESLVG